MDVNSMPAAEIFLGSGVYCDSRSEGLALFAIRYRPKRPSRPWTINK